MQREALEADTEALGHDPRFGWHMMATTSRLPLRLRLLFGKL